MNFKYRIYYPWWRRLWSTPLFHLTFFYRCSFPLFYVRLCEFSTFSTKRRLTFSKFEVFEFRISSMFELVIENEVDFQQSNWIIEKIQFSLKTRSMPVSGTTTFSKRDPRAAAVKPLIPWMNQGVLAAPFFSCFRFGIKAVGGRHHNLHPLDHSMLCLLLLASQNAGSIS